MSDKVFVYGTLRKGCGNHRWLDGALYLGDTTISGHVMYTLHGGFPGVIEGDGEVFGEVYQLASITHLDPLEGYRKDAPTTGLYNRKLIDTEFGQAWIYIINYDPHGSIINDWKEFA